MRAALLAVALCASSAEALGRDVAGGDAGGETGWTQNYTLRVVPAPGGVTIDGRLDDWDRSGRIFLCDDLAAHKHTRSADVMAMYDDEALYLAADVRDPTPLRNRVDPAKNPGGGWRGDCLQVRLRLPGDGEQPRIFWLDAWYHRPGDDPALQLAQRQPEQSRTDLLEHGGEAAFRVLDTDDGYVQEMNIPWAALGLEDRVAAGFEFDMGLEVVGGRDGGRGSAFRIVDLIAFRGAPTKQFYRCPQRWGTARLMKEGNLTLAEYETHQEQPGGPLAVRPINVAEALIEPFYKGHLSGFEAWRIDACEACDVLIRDPFLTGVQINWQRGTDARPVVRMSRAFDVPVGRYDRLLLHASLPKGSRLRLIAETDAGRRVLEREALEGKKREYTLDLEDAQRITDITLEIHHDRAQPAAARLGWLGLQDIDRMDELMAHFHRFDERWQGYLQPPSHRRSFEPHLGVFLTSDELAALRERHAAYVAEYGESPLADIREWALSQNPEQMIREHTGRPGRFGRDRGISQRGMTSRMAEAAMAGLIIEDAELLRRAARQAMAVAMTESWHESFYSYLPGSTHDHRAFDQSKIVEALAIILDAAGELMTPHARRYLLRRIANDGVNWITYNAWRYEYIHHMNQLAWFADGWLAGYAVMAQEMPRVKPYADLAYQSLAESMSGIILPDGGYEEGPAYFATVVGHGGEGLYYYSRLTGKTLQEITPETLQETADFAEVIRSTDRDQDFIPFADSWKRFQKNAGAFMAALLPDSAWVSIYRKSAPRAGSFPTAPMAMALEPQIPETGPEPRPFVQLATMGLTSSTRKLGEHWVKLLIVSNKDNASHNHEDKGSFVLEFAGQTFAADGGQVGYDDPQSNLMKHAQRHNMLLPTGLDARPAPIRDVGVLPEAEGDETGFRASMDLTPRWAGVYDKWTRTFESPRPDRLVITDDYELARGDGVAFYWSTFLPVEVRDDRVVITGRRGRVVLSVPDDCRVRVNELSMPKGPPQRRIAFERRRRSGRIVVEARLEATEPAP
ncbi:MAG: heparinase II/III domain-containing protein [Planctomycetota bacterium]